jgi:hypothetical protein
LPRVEAHGCINLSLGADGFSIGLSLQDESSVKLVGIGCAFRGRIACGQPYRYGMIVWMKKTLHIDEHLLREARTASGAKTDTDAVRLGLEALVRHAAYQRLTALRGSQPRARDVPRRRERTTSARHSVA